MTGEHVLLLAGTQEARNLAAALPVTFPDLRVTASFAGAVGDLPDPGVPARVGGFGGVDGLAAFLKEREVGLIVDATHPFAAQMSRNAVVAAERMKVPLIRLERPPWQAAAEDRWLPAASMEEAAGLLPEEARAFLAIGRKEIGAFATRTDIYGLARMIEPPQTPLPPHWDLVLARPSGSAETECALLRDRRITHVVSKNSGGTASYGKIAAARMLKIQVIMVSRPELPEAPVAGSAAEALEMAASILKKKS